MDRRWIGKTFIGLMLLLAAPASARHPVLEWMEGLISRVEPEFRELSILDYRTGTST